MSLLAPFLVFTLRRHYHVIELRSVLGGCSLWQALIILFWCFFEWTELSNVAWRWLLGIDLFLVTETVIASDINAYWANATLVAVSSFMVVQAVSFIRLRPTRTRPRRITRYAELFIRTTASRIRTPLADDLRIWFALPLEAHWGHRGPIFVLIYFQFVLCQSDSLEGGTFFNLAVFLIFSWWVHVGYVTLFRPRFVWLWAMTDFGQEAGVLLRRSGTGHVAIFRRYSHRLFVPCRGNR